MRNVASVTFVGLCLASVFLQRRLARRAAGPPRLGHLSESEQQFLGSRTRVVILGGGFGGLAAALSLDRRIGDQSDVSVLLIDRDNSSLFTPILWTVADGRANPGDVVVPIRDFQRGRRFHVLQAEIQGIDLERREIQTDAGVRPYDHLIIALGSVTQIPNLPGVRENSRTFRTPADAVNLRDHLIDAVEAAHRATSEEERQAWLTFVVVGGGDTGVELAATIHSYLAAGLLYEYPWLANSNGPAFRVVLVGRAPHLVPLEEPADSEATRQILEQQGIEVMTGTDVQAVRPDAVVTSRGEIGAHTVFWAAGISPPELLRGLPVTHEKGGAIVVDDHLRLADHPEVRVVGDAAWANDLDGRAVPPTAQAAQRAGEYAGEAVAELIHGRPEIGSFRYVARGHLELLGPGKALARIGPIAFGGLPAYLSWHGYYLLRIPNWQRRLELLSSWGLSMVFGRELAQLRMSGGGSTARLSAVAERSSDVKAETNVASP
jgi:NADH dehydrogenase